MVSLSQWMLVSMSYAWSSQALYDIRKNQILHILRHNHTNTLLQLNSNIKFYLGYNLEEVGKGAGITAGLKTSQPKGGKDGGGMCLC